MKKKIIPILLLIVMASTITFSACSSKKNTSLTVQIINQNNKTYCVCKSFSQDENDNGTQLMLGNDTIEEQFLVGSLIIGSDTDVKIVLNGEDITSRLIRVTETNSPDVQFAKSGTTIYSYDTNSRCIINLFDEIKNLGKPSTLIITIL